MGVKTELTIEASPALAEDLSGWLEAWPHKLYHYCPGVTARAQATYLWQAIRRAQESGATTYFGRKHGELRGLVQLETLNWDSAILGFPVGRIALWIGPPDENDADDREELLRVVLAEARGRGIRYLLARMPAGDIQAIHLLERNDFELVDGLLTFGRPLAESIFPPAPLDGLNCIPFQGDELDALREISTESFSIDRFHADPVIGKAKADAVHRRWIEDACGGGADCVLVAHAGKPVGFTTLRLDALAQEVFGVRVGIIVLVATSSDSRRQGVAQSLTQAALAWLQERGCQWVEVGTQTANLAASRVYQSAGFKLVASSLTFRRFF